MDWKAVTSETCFQSKQLDLGLKEDLAFDFRVYGLRCQGGAYYAGVEHKIWLTRRLADHFQGKGSEFTMAHKPLDVVLVLPAKTRAAEAFVYAALVEMQTSQKKCELVGGWTQTSPRPSPLCCLLIKETKRNLDRECFKCGGDHFAKNCTSKLLQPTCWYPCKNCGEKLYLTSRGQTPKPKAGDDSFLSCERGDPQPDQQAVSSNSGSAGTGNKRKAEEQQGGSASTASVGRVGGAEGQEQQQGATAGAGDSASREPTRKRMRKFLKAKVCGKTYTTVSWFFGVQNPSPSRADKTREHCLRRALELQRGDAKTLKGQDFAHAERPKDLLPGRTNLPTNWTDTACESAYSRRHSGAKKLTTQLRKWKDDEEDEGQQSRGRRTVLFRVEDLEGLWGKQYE